jgi:peptidoglycan/LPS O-acetylase OafA/YrhL
MLLGVSNDKVQTEKKRQHLYSLDFLRGFAALSVCLLHFTVGVLPNVRNTPLTPLFGWGYLGVQIFFIISGFVIPYVLDRSNYFVKDFASFMGKRILRICPPSYFAILLVISQRLFIDFCINHNRTYTADLSVYQIIDNLLYSVPYTSGKWFNGVFWTLAVEFQYYVLIGFCFGLLKKGLLQVVVFALLCNLLYAFPLLEKVQFFAYNSYFVLGILIWMQYSGRINSIQFWVSALLILCLIYYQTNYLAMIFSLLTTICILFFNVKCRIFSFFGKISYSLYLLHHVVGTTVEAFWIKIFPVVTLIEKVWLLIACLIGTIIASYIFHLLIEMPFMKLAERAFKKKQFV